MFARCNPRHVFVGAGLAPPGHCVLLKPSREAPPAAPACPEPSKGILPAFLRSHATTRSHPRQPHNRRNHRPTTHQFNRQSKNTPPRPPPRRGFRNRPSLRPLKRNRLRNEIDERPNPRHCVADQRYPQPRPNVWHRPRCNECRDHRKFEQTVNRHPESPSRNPAAVRLNEIRSLRPRGINNQHFVEPTPDNHQRKTFSSNRKHERQ
jgi:hypothetical protein